MLKSAFSIILLFAGLHLFAQIDGFVKMEWGDVPLEDREMTVYSLDSSAQAVVLGVEGRMIVSTGNRNFEYTLIRHKRIKILDKGAIDEYGNVSIFYYHKDNLENVRNIKAQTISSDGRTKEVNSKEIYREKINERWTKITFAFPNVEVGNVLEYRYQLDSDRVFAPEEWTFREEIPVRSSYFKFRNDAPLIFTYLLRGANYMPYEKMDDGQSHFVVGDMNIWVKGTEFFMKYGSALTEEPYMTTLDDYRVTVHIQYNGPAVEYDLLENDLSTVWDQTAVELLESENLGNQFLKKNRSKKIRAASESYIDTMARPQEKLFQIAQFVSKNIKWNDVESIYTKLSPDEAYELQETSLAAIQYAGLALLHHYGFEAYPVFYLLEIMEL